MTAFRLPPAPLQPPPPSLYNYQQFGASVVPTGPSQAEILEAQRKALEKRRRRNERARAKKLHEKQEKATRERAAAQEQVGIMLQPVPQTAVAATAYSNNQAFPPAILPIQHSTAASSNLKTHPAPILSSSQFPRANHERPVQNPTCPLCSNAHESGQCPILNNLQSLYFVREQIRNEPGIETSEERVSGSIPAMALS